MNVFTDQQWQPLTPEQRVLNQSFAPIRLSTWHRFWNHSFGRSGVILLSLIFVTMVAAPFLSDYTYDGVHLSLKNQPPSLSFWFGTDDLGRDIFTRVWYGARISLAIGCLAALIDLAVGLLWGGICGLSGGYVDEILMRLADILYSLPYLLIVILVSVILGSGFLSLLLAITMTGWILMARIVRGQILTIKERDFVTAARAFGASRRHLLFVHLLPNAIGPILITLTLTIPSAIFAEAFLSFLGLGIQAPYASWGTMVHEGVYALQFYPWRLFFPAFFMSLTLLGFHLIGEGLKFAFDQSHEAL